MTIINSLPFDLQNGTTADATQVMADFDGIVDDVNSNAAHNGANNDITALTALTTPITPAQGGTTNYIGGTSAGTANAQTVSTTPTGFALTNGYRVTFIAGFTNTAAMTLTVDATTVKNVFRMSPDGPQALTGGEVVIGNTVEVVYDGTQFELITTQTQFGGFGTRANMASAATVDLGLVGTHDVAITGVVTITSFGSSASLTFPVYLVQFSGVLTLTHTAGVLILPGGQSITTAAGDTCLAHYLGSGIWRVYSYSRASGQALQFNPSFLQGYINGLTLSTAGSSSTMGIAAGQATDSTGAGAVMQLASAYTKTTSSWAVGTGNGGLDTGAIATSTAYHFYLIERVDTGVTDIIFSLSASSPTLPANYTLFRRIGSMRTNGSSQWVTFTQVGDQFILNTQVDCGASVGSGSRTSVSLAAAIPTGIVVTALIRGLVDSGGSNTLLVTSLLEADVSATAVIADITQQTASAVAVANMARLTNSSVQVGVRANTTLTPKLFVYGWIDDRGKT